MLRETTPQELAAREPLPILVADLPAESSFEVTRLDEMIPARGDHTMTIQPSEWSEAMESAPPVGAPMWKTEAGDPSVGVSSEEQGGEVISEPWRLAAEKRPEPAPAAPPEEMPAPAIDDPASATQHLSPSDLPWTAPEAKEDDSANATQIISAADVARALGKPTEPDGDFALGEPGEGVDASALGIEEAPPLEDDPIAGFELDYSAAPTPSVPMETVDLPPAPEAPPAPAEAREPVPEPEPLPMDEEPQEPWQPEESWTADAAEPDEAVRDELGSFTDDETRDEATAAIPRETVEASLDASPAPEPAAEPLPPWNPPADLDSTIARFNNKHKLVFRLIRSEVGAGATNFVRSCGDGGFLASAELKADGTWEPDTLRTAVCEARVENPGAGFEGMLEREVESLRALAGEARIRTLVEQLRQL